MTDSVRVLIVEVYLTASIMTWMAACAAAFLALFFKKNNSVHSRKLAGYSLWLFLAAVLFLYVSSVYHFGFWFFPEALIMSSSLLFLVPLWRAGKWVIIRVYGS